MNMTKELFAGVAACCLGAACVIGLGGLYFFTKWEGTKVPVESLAYLSGLIAMAGLMGLVGIAAVGAAVGAVLCEVRDHVAGKATAPCQEPAIPPTIIESPPKRLPPVVAVPPVVGPVCVVTHRH